MTKLPIMPNIGSDVAPVFSPRRFRGGWRRRGAANRLGAAGPAHGLLTARISPDQGVIIPNMAVRSLKSFFQPLMSCLRPIYRTSVKSYWYI